MLLVLEDVGKPIDPQRFEEPPVLQHHDSPPALTDVGACDDERRTHDFSLAAKPIAHLPRTSSLAKAAFGCDTQQLGTFTPFVPN